MKFIIAILNISLSILFVACSGGKSGGAGGNQAARLFILDNSKPDNSIVRIDADPTAVWSNNESGNLKLILSAAMNRNGNQFLYTAQSLRNGGLVAFSQSEAESCAKDRFAAYFGSPAEHNWISPSVPILFSPCRTIFVDIEKTSYQNGFLKSLIAIVFADVEPSNKFNYNGWDLVLSQLAKEVLSQNKDIVAMPLKPK